MNHWQQHVHLDVLIYFNSFCCLYGRELNLWQNIQKIYVFIRWSYSYWKCLKNWFISKGYGHAPIFRITFVSSLPLWERSSIFRLTGLTRFGKKFNRQGQFFEGKILNTLICFLEGSQQKKTSNVYIWFIKAQLNYCFLIWALRYR